MQNAEAGMSHPYLPPSLVPEVSALLVCSPVRQQNLVLPISADMGPNSSKSSYQSVLLPPFILTGPSSEDLSIEARSTSYLNCHVVLRFIRARRVTEDRWMETGPVKVMTSEM